MFKRTNLPFGIQTPNIEISKGERVAKLYVAASYLPLVRYDDKMDDYVVISYGKVLARDNNGFVVPAGLAKDLEVAIAGAYADKAAFIAATASFANVYTATDVQAGTKNAAGDNVTAGEPVVASFFANYDATDTQNVYISYPLGIAPVNVMRQNGAGYGNGYQSGNSAKYRYSNWSLQHGITILTRYFIELPVVSDLSTISLPGMTVFEGTPNKTGLVTFTANSNFTSFDPLAASNFTATTAGSPTDEELKAEFDRIATWSNKAKAETLGRIYFINDEYPQGFLEWVRTYDAGLASQVEAYNVPAGSSTNGLPNNLYAAGITDPAQAKTVRINLLIQ